MAQVSTLVAVRSFFPYQTEVIDTTDWHASAPIIFDGQTNENMSMAIMQFDSTRLMVPLHTMPGTYHAVVVYSVVDGNGDPRLYAGEQGRPPTSEAFLVVR